MKKCPFCAEEVQEEAIVCKHCGRDILPGAATAEKFKKAGDAIGSFGITMTILVTIPIICICLAMIFGIF